MGVVFFKIRGFFDCCVYRGRDPMRYKCYGTTLAPQINYLEGKKRKSGSFKRQSDFAPLSPFLSAFTCAGLSLTADVTAFPSLWLLQLAK